MTDSKGYVDKSESFDDFLQADGLLEETEAIALKQVIADQVRAAMTENGLTKKAMAERMHSSRQQLDRLLDPHYPSVTLLTLRRAAAAVGRNLRIELV
ncbi:Fis family transcriptional regulator [Neorhizobium lilium]|uniref:Fis family transcriptional regulator n=1 Tax=Neorhizobium lilium TaxID=2503024 RepID=A0A3S3VI67_9HYPH|nr:XRE family transcriptional regulator [Neorhizobium lilium]RWX77221.1 Fis family transcriptional regulator [Neorhizobium lilium]